MKKLLAMLLLTAAAQPALALRCGNRLITDGDPATRVLALCGDPVQVTERVAWRSFYATPAGWLRYPAVAGRVPPAEAVLAPVAIEEWLYNFGPRKLMRVVTLEDGRVTRVEELGYGYAE